MKFIQNKKDGSCEWHFEKHEIDIINKNKKLHFSPEALRHFGNNLMRMVAEWNLHFKEDVKNLKTQDIQKLKNDKSNK